MLNLLSVILGDTLLLASADNMSAEMELLAVVWEVRESVLYMFGMLLDVNIHTYSIVYSIQYIAFSSFIMDLLHHHDLYHDRV